MATVYLDNTTNKIYEIKITGETMWKVYLATLSRTQEK